MALCAASQALEDDDLELEAKEIARHDAYRPPEDAGIHDAGLCHGAAGLAHIQHRLYRATGDEMFGESSQTWFERALQFRKSEGQFIGGFGSWWSESRTWRASPGLLMGSAGLGLAFLSAISETTLDWDRPMFPGLTSAN